MNIRPYQSSDKQEILQLIELHTPQFFAPEEKEDFSQYLDKEIEDYFVMEQDAKLIGCGGINYFAVERLARISWDMIHPDFLGQGIGAQLVKFRIEKIKEQDDLDKVVVRTSQLANTFYEKMGFTLVRKELDYWAKGLDLYYMEMSIV